MTKIERERCPDCKVELPKLSADAPTHRYLGASASCWALFSNIHNAGEPPIAPHPLMSLFIDAYAAQHHGVPSPQAINSVAVHLLTLHAVLTQQLDVSQALWVRRRALENKATGKHERFHWLTPPDFAGCVTVLDIANAPTPEGRAETAVSYIHQVYERWAKEHSPTLTQWYQQYVH